MIRSNLSLAGVAAITLSVVACDSNPTAPVEGVFLLTNERVYEVSASPVGFVSVFATVHNQTFGPVPVRRCLIGDGDVDPFGMDLVFEKEQADGSWQPIDLGVDCSAPTAQRADVVLAPYEVALVARVNIAGTGRYRFRHGYGSTVETAPADTLISPVFTVR